MERNVIHTGDSLEVLDTLDENSVHAIVTDPPYGLAFMGRDWDTFEPKEYQEWCESWASKAKRVLRPGGHLLAFSGNRTHHRLFSGVEDAGFEIRDTITWHYGSGFPKALDVSKAIDKQAGAEREVVGTYDYPDGKERDIESHKQEWMHYGETNGLDRHMETAPATEAAKKWDGWKTALKPATEFVVLARKPLSEGTVAENVQEWGTGALNIDGTRVGTEERKNAPPGDNDVYSQAKGGHGTVKGRYPANVIFDDIEAERLDREVGETYSGEARDRTGEKTENKRYANEGGTNLAAKPGKRAGIGDSGGPSRYFYTSKATKAERTLDGRIENAHPTVKPTDLMEWLVKLATAEGQTVLDPFTGTGTTLKAAKNLNREFIGVEKDPKWADVARVRVGLTPENPSVVRNDNSQIGIEAYTD